MDGYYSKEKKEKYRQLAIEYIKNNPFAKTIDLRRDLKIKLDRIFLGGIKEAYSLAQVPLPKHLLKRTRQELRDDIIRYIQENPLSTVTEIQNATYTCLPREFGSIKNAFDIAGVAYPHRQGRRTLENLEMLKRAREFEDYILYLFSLRGSVQKYYRTSQGIADALFIEEGTRIIIEIKDFQKNNITLSEIKQINRYITSTAHCNTGFLITHKNNKGCWGKWKDIYIEGNRISILSVEEILSGFTNNQTIALIE